MRTESYRAGHRRRRTFIPPQRDGRRHPVASDFHRHDSPSYRVGLVGVEQDSHVGTRCNRPSRLRAELPRRGPHLAGRHTRHRWCDDRHAEADLAPGLRRQVPRGHDRLHGGRGPAVDHRRIQPQLSPIRRRDGRAAAGHHGRRVGPRRTVRPVGSPPDVLGRDGPVHRFSGGRHAQHRLSDAGGLPHRHGTGVGLRLPDRPHHDLRDRADQHPGSRGAGGVRSKPSAHSPEPWSE